MYWFLPLPIFFFLELSCGKQSSRMTPNDPGITQPSPLKCGGTYNLLLTNSVWQKGQDGLSHDYVTLAG